jgi:hypothetical protein
MTPTAIAERRELAHRTSDGIEVTLFWTKATNTVAVAVLDTRSGEALEFDVSGSAALDAFNHRRCIRRHPARSQRRPAQRRCRSLTGRTNPNSHPAPALSSRPHQGQVMHSPSLQRPIVQAHVQQLHRSRQTSSTKPITRTDRTPPRQRRAAKLSV